MTDLSRSFTDAAREANAMLAASQGQTTLIPDAAGFLARYSVAVLSAANLALAAELDAGRRHSHSDGLAAACHACADLLGTAAIAALCREPTRDDVRRLLRYIEKLMRDQTALDTGVRSPDIGGRA